MARRKLWHRRYRQTMHRWRTPGQYHSRAARVIGAIYLCVVVAVLAVSLSSRPAQAQTIQAQRIPVAAQQYKRTLLRAAHSQWGLDAPVAMFAAQVHQESAWQPGAVSHVGARGLAQFMPSTSRWWCELTGTAAADCLPHNPTWALRAMVGYDLWLYRKTPLHYSEFDRLWVTLRAYNGGLGHWQREAAASGHQFPSRTQVDATCGKARRHPVHCRENLGYPSRILLTLQPRYASWGRTVAPPN